jgi:hypothetical protein
MDRLHQEPFGLIIANNAAGMPLFLFPLLGPRMIIRQYPTINLEDHGVAPGNLPSSNSTAIANVLAKVASMGGAHVKLTRPGTYLLEQGPSANHALLRACILLPSYCRFDVGEGCRLKLKDNGKSYLIRNSDPVNGNTAITITGGIWDGNFTNDPSPGAPGDYSGANALRPFYGFLGRLENVSQLRMADITSIDPSIWAWNGVRVYDSTFERFQFLNCRRDGIHLHDSKRVTIRVLKGTCHDNMVANSTTEGDYWESNFIYNDGTNDLVSGDIEDLLIEDLQVVDSNGPIRLFGWDNTTIRRVTIRGLRGTTATNSIGGVQVIEDGLVQPEGCEIRDLLIEDIALQTQTGEPAVLLAHNSLINATVRNVVCHTGKGVSIGGTGFDTIRIENVTNPGTSQDHCIELGVGATNVTAKNIHIDGVTSSPTGGSGRLIQMANTIAVGNLTADNLSFCGVSDATLIGHTGSVRQKLQLGHVHVDGGSFGVFLGPLDVFGDNLHLKDNPYLGVGSSRIILDAFTIAGTANGRIGSVAGAGGSLAVAEQIQTTVRLHTDVTGTFSASYAFDLPKLPRGAIVTGHSLVCPTAFAGVSATAFIRRKDTNAYVGGSLALTSAGQFTSQLANEETWAANADPQLWLHLVSGFGDFNLASAGVLYVNVFYKIVGQVH